MAIKVQLALSPILHIEWPVSYTHLKQNGFKALVYLHRYTPDTIGNLRIDYLHKMQRVYESEINRMQDMIDHSDNAREVAAASKRKDKLAKQLKECREYDEKISHLALSRIELDLDDGVKVNYRKLQTAQDGKDVYKRQASASFCGFLCSI